MAEPIYDVPAERKTLYYVGMGISLIGFMLFLSNFCIIGCGISGMDNSSHFLATFDGHGDAHHIDQVFVPFDDARSRMAGFVFRAVGGFVLVIVGQTMMNIGRRGWAGSGVLLDPRQSRKDLEPLNRAAGGMVNDALEEVSVLKSPISEPTIKVRCRSCTALNDEAAKFCNQCGKPV